mmetsp:Transcript_11013/g.12478  ORF Transcript_11013/g.12478 Transcript_11013/m.12478 type:complete len:95 (+) Transcript_11013:485-769(+)
MSEEELNKVFNSVDTDNNGAINYTEFIAATLNLKSITDKKRLKKIFDMIDINNDGYVNYEDLTEAIKNKENSSTHLGDSHHFINNSLLEEVIRE